MFAHVFKAEEAAIPHVREAVAASVLGRAFSKAEVCAGGIGGGGCGVFEDVTQIRSSIGFTHGDQRHFVGVAGLADMRNRDVFHGFPGFRLGWL